MKSITATAAACLLSVTLLAPATADTPAPLTINPMPGISLQVPMGWKACDDTNDKALGSADDPMKLKAQICKAAANNPSVKLIVFSPQVGQSSTLIFMHTGQPPITPDVIGALTDEMLLQVADSLKGDKKAELEKSGSKLDDLTVRKDTIDGHPALVSTVLQTPPSGAISQVYTETWEVPTGQNYYQFSFIWPKLLATASKPPLDAARATIKIAETP